MFVIPGILFFFTFVYIRPQEIYEFLHPVGFVHMVGILALGYLLDLRTGITRLFASPLLLPTFAFYLWSFITIVIKAPNGMDKHLPLTAASLVGFLAASQALQNLRALTIAATIVLVLATVLAYVSVQQGLSQAVCFDRNDDAAEPDVGRPCANAADCRKSGDPGGEYTCARPGPMGTRSVGDRVRFRGQLEDPNELAWVVSSAIPIAFSWYERRRNLRRIAITLAVAALCVTAVIMTKSRSGQLSLTAVLGVYFLRRFGKKGVIVAAILSVPVMMLGGRSGEEAESSSDERLGCWSEAMGLWRENPLMGVGGSQFTEHHYLTAHNSYMLVLAELGPLGLFLWSCTIYLAFKIVVRVQSDFANRPEAANARTWATALLGMMAGFVVSAFFLSLPYHAILWVEIGLCGALYATVRRHEPTWSVALERRDFLVVGLLDIGIISAIGLYLRSKGI